jgi:hypothetical protein
MIYRSINKKLSRQVVGRHGGKFIQIVDGASISGFFCSRVGRKADS